MTTRQREKHYRAGKTEPVNKTTEMRMPSDSQPAPEKSKQSQWTKDLHLTVLDRQIINREPVLKLQAENGGDSREYAIEHLTVQNFSYYLCLKSPGESDTADRIIVEIIRATQLRVCSPETFMEIQMSVDKRPRDVPDRNDLTRLLGEFVDKQASQSMTELVKRGKQRSS
jgi:hypothetical protein